MAGGRPTDYTPEFGDLICENIAKGVPLSRMCEAEGMPNPSTVYRWRRLNPEFSNNYTEAREDQADRFADEILTISDEATPADIQVAKLKTDTRKWLASNFNRAYQEKKTTAVTGANGGPIQVADMSRFTDEDLIQIAAGTYKP